MYVAYLDVAPPETQRHGGFWCRDSDDAVGAPNACLLALSGCNWLSLGNEFSMNYALVCLAWRPGRRGEGEEDGRTDGGRLLFVSCLCHTWRKSFKKSP